MDVVDWLLDGDPALRWQTLRDLADADPAEVERERARVAREGLGAEILRRQTAAGPWQRGDDPLWLPTLHNVQLLRATGVDPRDPVVAAAIGRLASGFRWHEEFGAKPFFEGETEPCINGRALGFGAYFGRPAPELLRRLLGEQLADGGWNCKAPASTRASFHTTICVLEGLLDYQRAGAPPELATACARAEAYLLDRAMFRRRSTGEVADPSFTTFAFPTRYSYDVLRGLDYLRDADATPDERIHEAVGVIESRRQADGRWRLDAMHDGGLEISLGEKVGEPSRWITLRALRVLRWAKVSSRRGGPRSPG